MTTTEEPLAQAKPPFLRRVRIRGYKSIAFCDVTLEPHEAAAGTMATTNNTNNREGRMTNLIFSMSAFCIYSCYSCW